ncbi:MAG: Electron transfer flavoprotein-ubiquinone oxidoreductase [Glaciecola sp. HTCC2999]|jgi:electron-transferring-flavoprotein dehydrogenase|nr:MAG: Electron transfer flavoprotein-ubiquinone oxidoreductase [Glaciecola sp. HTCC2999]
MEFDVVIVGAGPSGLSSAIKLMQLAQAQNKELMVCVVEKGSEVGAHILSGAVFETRALDELLPNWRELDAPINTPVTRDEIYYLTGSDKAVKLPNIMTPKTMHNEGNYIVSMANVTRWLATQAEQLGVEIFPGFAAAETIIEDGIVKGIITGDMGISENGTHKDSYMPGMELRAKYTIFAEGCRGHLGKTLINTFALDKDSTPQHYAIGFKEIWDIDPAKHQPGLVVHTAGWPLTDATGGSYLYHAENNQVLVGLIVDLNYANPHLSPFDEFQQLKHHPTIKQYLEGGTRVSYGARAIAKGGFHSLPKMTVPGAILVGCEAGTLNFAKIKGNHTAMKSGMLAAEAIFNNIDNEVSDLKEFTQLFKSSWLYNELFTSRNFGPAIHKWGNFIGGAFNTLDQNIFNGKLPINLFDHDEDHAQMKNVKDAKKINYPKYDNKISFDKLSSVFLSNTNHEEDQPCHLRLKDPQLPIKSNLKEYDEPAQRYCPAGVYEVINDDNGDAIFNINSQNCIHCKTCDIKEPNQNIDWIVPEGAGGPNYPNM